MRSNISLDEVFAILGQCAADGRRCPENSTGGIGHGIVPALARAGRLRIEVSGQNWRQVHILTGPHAGKSTAPNPVGAAIYRILDRDGDRRVTKPIDPSRPSTKRQQPSSLPRF